MRAFFVACALCAGMWLSAGSALAQTVDCTYLTVELPAGWKVIGEPSEDANGVFSAIFGKEDHTASVTLVSSVSGGKSAKELAELLGTLVGAQEAPSALGNRYGFHVFQQEQEGFCSVATSKDRFLMTCQFGDRAAAYPLLDGMKSSDYPELVAR